jgi:hypothetical protein
MSCLNYAEIDIDTSIVDNRNNGNRPGPVLVRAQREEFADSVARRVAEVVERQLANGNLPA